MAADVMVGMAAGAPGGASLDLGMATVCRA
jgi:hypothetical protein